MQPTSLKSRIKKNLLKVKPLVALYLLVTGKQARKPDNRFKHLLGMTTSQERRLFNEYGARRYTGAGEIVDLGCWLGSTTVPLAEGLLTNQTFDRKNRKIYAYDLFIWGDWMNVQGSYLDGRYKEGDSFVDAYREVIKPYADMVDVNAGDLCQLGWKARKPIEFLLIDAMKSWELANAILRDFFPFLIPGKSHVLHQDFAHFYTPWIHLLMYRFRDHFALVEDVMDGGSTLFRYTRPIPPADLARSYGFADFTDAEVDRAFAYSLQLVHPHKRNSVWAAKAMTYVHQHQLEKGRAVVEQARQAGIDPGSSYDFTAVNAYFQEAQ